MKTLLLDLDNWDLCIDASGNIALATEPYAIAQDVASYLKTFAGECYYDDTKGIPYFSEILGQNPPVSLFQEYMVTNALQVPLVVPNPAPLCSITGFENRGVQGQITFTDSDGTTQTVTLQ